MRIAIIGAAGHYHQVLEGLGQEDSISAICPGESGENIDGLIRDTLKMQPLIYTSISDMLRQEKPDICAVNPPFSSIAPVSMECLEAGCHVYSEKPLSTDMEALARLERIWEKSGRALGGMFQHQCEGWFLALEDAVRRGEIGQIRLAQGRKSYKMGQRPEFYHERARYGGMLPWVGIHMIELILRLCGRCVRVSAEQDCGGNRGQGELETSAACLMRFESGALAMVTADYFRPDGCPTHGDDRLSLTGDRGYIEAVGGRVYLENELPKRELPLPPSGSIFRRFVDAIGTPEADAMGRAAIAASQVALLARKAGDEHKTLSLESISPQYEKKEDIENGSFAGY